MEGTFHTVVYYRGSGGDPIVDIYPVHLDKNGSKIYGPPLRQDSKEYRDVAADYHRILNTYGPSDNPRVRFLARLVQPYFPAAAALARTRVGYFVGAAGAWLRRFDPSQNKFIKTAQFTCSGSVENAVDFDVSQDRSTGVMLTYSPTSKQYCVVIFDPASFATTGKVPIPDPNVAHQILMTPDGSTAYVNTDTSVRGVSTPSIIFSIDLKKKAMGPTITSDETRLDHMVMTPDGSRLFLSATTTTQKLVVVDLPTLTPSTFSIKGPTFCDPQFMAMHPNGSKLYMIGMDFAKDPLCVIDTSTVTVRSVSFPFATTSTQIGITPQGRSAPEFTPGGRYLTVMGVATEIVTIDTVTDKVVARLPIPPLNGSGAAISFFYVPN
jgi:hypothetical protein